MTRAVQACDGLELLGEADGGRAALRAIAELEPEVVIRPAEPDLDGMGVLRALQAQDEPPDCRVMLVSATIDDVTEAEARAAGGRVPEQGARPRRSATSRCASSRASPALRSSRNRVSRRGARADRPMRVNSDDTGRIRVLVADDHPLYREAVVRAIRARPEFELIGQAQDGREALGAIREDAPDVAVLDVEMPSMGGVDVVRAVNRDALGTRIVLLSAHLESDTVYAAVQAGVAPTCRRRGRPSASATRCSPSRAAT